MYHRNFIATLVIFLASFSVLFCQPNWSKYHHVKDIQYSSVPQLASAITSGIDSDREKVEAIYYWVTNNIQYDYKLYLKIKEREKKKKPPRYTGAALAIKEDEMILTALRNGKGVCEHYALIFRGLCRKVGIKAEVVAGYGKTDPLKTKSSGIKHAWNAVQLDYEWHLFDPTWGSGYVNKNNNFVPNFNGDYAFTTPEAFAMNHFPKDMKWQLSQYRMDRTAYRSVPVIGPGYFRSEISDLTPKHNIIEAVQGDTILIQFNSPEEIGEIKCRNIKSNEKVPTALSANGKQYKLTLNTEMMRSGNYSFYFKSMVLFTYKITVSR